MTPPAVKVNPRVQAIRERTGHGLSVQETMDAANDIVGGQNVELQKEQEETKGYVVAEPTLKKVLAILKFRGKQTAKNLGDILDMSSTTTMAACKSLEKSGLVECIEGRPKTFIYIKTPEGWVLEDDAPVKSFTVKAKAKDYSNNPLTKMLMKKDPTVLHKSVKYYKQLFDDLSGDYGGIEEIMALVECIRRLCMERMMLATEQCPLCGNMLGRKGTEVFCEPCNRYIDMKDSVKSLDAYLKLAEMEKEGGE